MTVESGAPAHVVLPPTSAPQARLTWEYPPSDFIEFRVYASTNYTHEVISPIYDGMGQFIEGYSTNTIGSWRFGKLYGTTTNLFYPITMTEQYEFFRVTASNIVTGLESE